MKTLAKPIAIFLILALTVFSVDAQITYNEYKMNSATYYYGDIYTQYEEGTLLIVEGLNGEKLLANTIRITFVKADGHYFIDEDYMLVEMQTLDSHEKGRIEWYKEEVVVLNYEKPDYPDFGKGTISVEGLRKNGEDFIYVQNLKKNLRRVHIINEFEEKEYVISISKQKN